MEGHHTKSTNLHWFTKTVEEKERENECFPVQAHTSTERTKDETATSARYILHIVTHTEIAMRTDSQ